MRDVPDVTRPITGPISKAEEGRVARFPLLHEAVRFEATMQKTRGAAAGRPAADVL